MTDDATLVAELPQEVIDALLEMSDTVVVKGPLLRQLAALASEAIRWREYHSAISPVPADETIAWLEKGGTSPWEKREQEEKALRAEVEKLRAVVAVSVELREAERRTAAECSGGDMGHPRVSKAHHDEMRVREKWRAALDAAKEG